MSITDTTASPHVKLRSIGLHDVRWTGGFWGDWIDTCRDRMVPIMKTHMCETDRVKFVGNFEVAVGTVEGRHRGPRWNDGDFYKWLEGATASAGLSGDKNVIADVESLAKLIASAQREDGYIHTDIQIRQKSGEVVAEFDNPMDFEMYNMGHLITLAVTHRRATGSETLMKLALRAADFLDRTFADPKPHQARHGICPSHLMGLIELYRETKNPQHRDLAKRLLEMRNLVEKGDDDNQDRVPFRDHTTAHGHAVRATYLYAGMADIYAETGDESLLKPLNAVWEDLTGRKLYITGGCGALFDGASPDGSADQLNITRVHQAFGRDYQLPHSTAHNETCAAIGNVFWNWRMLQITGDAKFADVTEQTLYNSVLAGVSLDGASYTYTNTLRKLDPMPVPLRWSADRKASISCFCCPPNVVRTVAESAHYAYLRTEDAVHIVLYGTNFGRFDIAGRKLTLDQKTNYPWDGTIELRVGLDKPGRFTIALRIPSWAVDAKIDLNGAAQSVDQTPNTFAHITRDWNDGDVIRLELPMHPRLIEANPYIEEARQHAAVVRGPIVYCLESCDLPEGVSVLDVALVADKPMEVGAPDASIGGACPITTTGVLRRSEEWDKGMLYRTLQPLNLEPVPLQLVPYYTWGNREPGEMSVWLPVLF